MELFKRFPRFRLLREERPLVSPEERSNYPSFTADFATLERELMPHFYELDSEALRRQNWYRWMYIILIFGGAIATILGIAQLAFLTTAWPGIAGTVVAAGLGLATAVSQAFNHHERYLNARLAAERLRGEYFLFLGRFDQYANDQDRVQKLIRRVAEIKIEGEHYGSA